MILQCGKAVSGQGWSSVWGKQAVWAAGASQPPGHEQLRWARGACSWELIGASSGPARSGKQSGPQIQNDRFNKYAFGFYISVWKEDDGLTWESLLNNKLITYLLMAIETLLPINFKTSCWYGLSLEGKQSWRLGRFRQGANIQKCTQSLSVLLLPEQPKEPC